MDKKLIMLGMAVGSVVGGYVPVIFGADGFSLISIAGGVIGGLLGIWLAFKFFRY